MRKGPGVFMTSGTYPWSFVTQIFHNDQPSYGGDRIIFEAMPSTQPRGTPFVPFLLTIALSVLQPWTDSDYPFGIFKLFLWLLTTTFKRFLLYFEFTLKFNPFWWFSNISSPQSFSPFGCSCSKRLLNYLSFPSFDYERESVNYDS
jgi:hypothetical protein